ncbi:MAG: glycosyl transferase [Paludibacteraceae bacterium]|nr:glycosyl transferase [Paludibacteraceae bacterium]
MTLSPIIVFAYNRPEHLRKTLNWLGQNELAEQSTLYIFCDGPKNKDALSETQLKRFGSYDTYLAKIGEARSVAREVAIVPTFKEVHVVEREENLGLGTSVITGVTEIINKYGRAIVLEDDLETSPYFLSYMNQCLGHYEARKSVFSISGLSRPHPERFYPKDYPYDVYVSLTHHPTGWATWADRWNQVDWKADAYEIMKEQPAMVEAFRRIEHTEWEALIKQRKTGQNVWSVRFGLAHFVNHAVSICPIVSYINHIGWDSEATNAVGGGSTWNFERLADNANIRFLDILYEDKRIINAWYSFTIPQRRKGWVRFLNWFGRTFLHKEEFALKGRVYV